MILEEVFTLSDVLKETVVIKVKNDGISDVTLDYIRDVARNVKTTRESPLFEMLVNRVYYDVGTS